MDLNLSALVKRLFAHMGMSISVDSGEDNCQQELWSEIAFTIALAQITLLWLWDTLHASPQLMHRTFNQICSIVQAVICQSVAIDCFGSFSIKVPLCEQLIFTGGL